MDITGISDDVALMLLEKINSGIGLIERSVPPPPEPEPEPPPQLWKQTTHGQEVEVKENECVVYMDDKDYSILSSCFGTGMYVPAGNYYRILTRPE